MFNKFLLQASWIQSQWWRHHYANIWVHSFQKIRWKLKLFQCKFWSKINFFPRRHVIDPLLSWTRQSSPCMSLNPWKEWCNALVSFHHLNWGKIINSFLFIITPNLRKKMRLFKGYLTDMFLISHDKTCFFSIIFHNWYYRSHVTKVEDSFPLLLP